MSYTLSLIGNVIRIESANASELDYLFPLNSTNVFIDEVPAEVTFFNDTTRARLPIASIATHNTVALLKAQLAAWQIESSQVGGKMGEPVEVTITRPADTAIYAANDVVSSSTTAPAAIILDLATAGVPAGGSGYLVKARFLTNQSTNVARYRVHLYKSAPAPVNDNAPFALLWANRANRIGFIDIPALNTAGAGSEAANALVADLRLAFKLAPAETRLWALVQILDGFTPASGQQFFLSVLADRN
jgi:hypothetical protein